ncbi:MAG: metapyrocatechase [Rhodospirillaceae bacterium]|jgi:catechol 2,3-dioxygenase-like lactoylglutathione lyase family enzyme|nr:metapyrocatechase [Rhodospirillaceae bacterium]MBT5674468.1 metapyrocatechase [Rhodospirillaceae bacterium]MBT6829084.1 metapyrocatechase [Rhodospirillaceae bacterium]
MAVQSLQHYCLAVPDPALGVKFYEDFGLEGKARSDHVALRCAGRDQDQVLLVEGSRRQLHHLCFATPAGELAALQQALEADGSELLDPPAAAAADGLWFHDPEGVLINVRAGEAAPWAEAPEWHINSPGHYTRQGERGYPPRDLVIKPRRLGHVLTFTTDFQRQVDFYTRVLGLRLSDQSEGMVAFLHCQGGSDHHVLAFLAGDRPGFHHASFEVANIDEVGLGGRQMIAKGYRDGWGFGRHVIGSNFFHYIRDPWNGLAEYFCDIDHIPADMDWEAKNWPLEDSLYVWGPDVPADFPINFENPN